MKKETKQLKKKAQSSLLCCVDHFNRPWDQGRADAVLIFLAHASEMLLKAAILHKGGNIMEDKGQTMSFDRCIRQATDGANRFLSKAQCVLLHAIGGERNAAQHHIVDVSEHTLYTLAIGGIQIFQDILENVFGENLNTIMPQRVLPLSTLTPMEILPLFNKEIGEIKSLLDPGKRRKSEAIAKLRGLAAIDNAIGGSYETSSKVKLVKICKQISSGASLSDIFPNVSSATVGEGKSLTQIDVRLSKNKGIPVKVVQEGNPSAMSVIIKPVNDTDVYKFKHKHLAQKLKLNQYQVLALVHYLNLRNDTECFKPILGYLMYSGRAIHKMKEALMNKGTMRKAIAKYKAHVMRNKKKKK